MSIKDDYNAKQDEKNRIAEEKQTKLFLEYNRSKNEKISEIINHITHTIKNDIMHSSPRTEYISGPRPSIFYPRIMQKYIYSCYRIALIKGEQLEFGHYYDGDPFIRYVTADDITKIEEGLISFFQKEQIKKCNNYGSYSNAKHWGYYIDGICDYTFQVKPYKEVPSHIQYNFFVEL